MTASQRIVFNTLATYGRSLLALALGLFSTRWVLNALGATDFGLYSVVGAIVVFITFLNGVMSNSIARFYAYAIGRGQANSDADASLDLIKWFNTSISVHAMLPLILIAIGYPVGIYAINHWLRIPQDRVHACLWVFRVSLVTAFVNMVSVPYTAMFVAHQYIADLAVFGVLRTVCVFVSAYLLLSVKSDRLIIYSLFMLGINAGIPILQMIRASEKFKACRIHMGFIFDCARLNTLFAFAGWQLFGGAGSLIRGQGTAVLLNLFFGPNVNAAYSVSTQLSVQASTLSGSLIGAMQPALTTAEGRGQRGTTLKLALRACKFSTFLILLFALPLMLEINTVLRLWLNSPPLHTAPFCIFMLVALLLDKSTIGHMMAISAQGNIAAYQMVLGTSLILTLPLTWILFKIGMGPVSLGYAFLSTMAFCSFGRLYFTQKQLRMNSIVWVRQVAFPICLISGVSLGLGFLSKRLLPADFIRICITSTITIISTSFLSLLFIFDKDERHFFLNQLRILNRKLKGQFH